MAACRSCGADNPEGQRFCGGCGAALGAAAPCLGSRGAQGRHRAVLRPRRLHGDLGVGATPRTSTGCSTAYFALARSQIEAHGGIVEKFIGDAVVGVFGVPAAHEDDPERAVRAALRIARGRRAPAGHRRRAAPAADRHQHRRGARPARRRPRLGRARSSPATRSTPRRGSSRSRPRWASRSAWRPTRRRSGDVRLRGAASRRPSRARPSRCGSSTPRAARARLGVDLTRTHAGAVRRARDRARPSCTRPVRQDASRPSSVQLVTVVGEPGIGKSRIVAELARARPGDDARAVTWRQGRCLPYGDGVTFWALGEIVKAQAGILESDDPETAAAKIDDVVPAGPDRGLAPPAAAAARRRRCDLVGRARGAVRRLADVPRGASPSATRRSSCSRTSTGPTTRCSPSSSTSPTRPTASRCCSSRRPARSCSSATPTFAAGLPNVNRINLAPLTDAETGRLVAGAPRGARPARARRRPILERAEGNPLYAEEFVRLLRDRDLLVEADGAVSLRPGAEIPLPELDRGAHRGPPRHAAGRAQGDARRRRRRGQGLLGGRGRGDGRPRRRRGRRGDARARAEGARPAGAALVDGRRGRVRLLARRSPGTSPTASCRARPGPRAMSPPPTGSRRRPASASRTSPRSSPTTTRPRSTSTRAAGQAERVGRAPGSRPCGSSCWPARRRCTSTRPAAVASFERALELAPPGHDARPAILARFGQAAYEDGRNHEAAAALEEAIASFRARGRPAGSRAGHARAVRRAPGARGPASVGDHAGGRHPPRTSGADPRARRRALQDRRQRDHPRPRRGCAVHRRTGPGDGPRARHRRAADRAAGSRRCTGRPGGSRGDRRHPPRPSRSRIHAGGRGVPATYNDLSATST